MPLWPGAPISTRRMLTVTICAPLASMASRMTTKSRYLPVPTSNRDSNDLPAMTSGSPFSISRFPLSASRFISPSLHHGHDLDDVAIADWHVRDLARRVDVVAAHDGHVARIHRQLGQQ